MSTGRPTVPVTLITTQPDRTFVDATRIFALATESGIEIDGEATAVALRPDAEEAGPALPTPLIPDQSDPIIVARLAARHVTVATGEPGHFYLYLLNNHDRPTHFRLRVEGWLAESWVQIGTPDPASATGRNPAHSAESLWLRPGEQGVLPITITPPRSPTSTAGEHQIVFVVQAPDLPGHSSRLGAVLTIKPYTHLVLGALQPRRATTSWQQPKALLTLSVTNQSNQPATILVRSADTRRRCAYEFFLPTRATPQPDRVTFTLAPGEQTQVHTRVTVRRAALFGLRPHQTTIRLATTVVQAQRTPLTAEAVLDHVPPIGPWLLATALGLGATVVGLLVLLAGLAALTAGLWPAAPPLPIPPTVQTMGANPPVVTIVVNLAQPAPTTPLPPLDPPPTPAEAVPPPLLQPAPGIPIVQPDQVSAPGARVSAAPPPPGQLRPVAARLAEPQTYQQMFEAVALRFDLNWRVLAAQAYLESSFDSLALGQSGDMGLMQILPGTWREWAPTVDAADPFDAQSNTLVAAAYLDYLRGQLGQRGYPQIEWMLVAYNWGLDKVNKHLDAGLGWDDLPAERRQYAVDILRVAETIP